MSVSVANFGVARFAFPLVGAFSPANFAAVGLAFPDTVFPAAGDVRAGTRYGYGGTEFTGALVVPSTPVLGPSVAATLGDAVTAWLNDPSRGWTLSGWTAVRTWSPDAELVDLAAEAAAGVPRVEVVPERGTPSEQETRAAEEKTWTVYIVIRQWYALTGAIPNSWVDPLAGLAEQVADQLRNTAFDTLGFKMYCEVTDPDPLIDPVELRERRTAVSVIDATFRQWRAAT